MKISSPASRRKTRIEIIPLIDVIFFLLATFMILSVSMVKNQGIDVNLPRANTGVLKGDQSTTTISITLAGDIYLDKEKISLEELPKRLHKLRAADSRIHVFINADEKASVGKAIEVLDIARKAGIAEASINVKTGKSQ